nr:delta-1-pyrroline-5-carboxylate synthase a isoform X2 (P5CSA) [Polytomella parva]|mmetsp:Transcript_14020/g.24577  ORF Transcript_14020/g.24577 Transcript_14020/m.24577 type:complete len:432 (-) Transcript_14020:356-1651(-)|eukprot:CAMPEP_0175056548 /NCGR_PEP_ID=MMETSP0052_2-20121109/10741_1 /TAXON_ID=51329 ORGANISM="Polytomella parva, Strain SAG 63-3" /NCGR_SAMPLE_ID=MMETSP0052_2 /ASSEMBLY_ACC=CAM_ASM_000194 /LENGTH=431 /DNA_ID=CAMNT_0016321605 /DNA_START=45 /DNA_END=1340 /DNA_ORIENTATION=-
MASQVREMAIKARAASRQLQKLSTEERVTLLKNVADAIVLNKDLILAENQKDIAESKGVISESSLQRLILSEAKLLQLSEGIKSIARQDEPIGKVVGKTEVSDGLVLEKITCPIGVLLVIFESRPDALPQIASLAIRSGNGLILKGGKEAAQTNRCLHQIVTSALGPFGGDLISLVQTREEISDLLALDDVIDLVIPRGGNALVSYIKKNTKIPVLGHADGICHVFLDEHADFDKSLPIIVDAKVDYPAACNAVETVLIHQAWLAQREEAGQSSSGLTKVVDALAAAGVAVHAGPRAHVLLPSLPAAPALRHEYSALACTVEVVDDLSQAIQHINTYGSGHTDCILTEDAAAAETFLRDVDSACVFHNASTRFADGFRFGLGAEVGISTSRIHARGPVGVEGLMTSKWKLRGSGQKVAKDKGVIYTHKPLL